MSTRVKYRENEAVNIHNSKNIEEIIDPIILNDIKTDVSQKGFSLYNWISFSELRQTVLLDYLSILSAINVPFAIIFIITGVINYAMFREGVISFGFLYVLFGGYALTFLVILWRILKRSWAFMNISNVIFTDTHIGLGDKLVHFNDYKDISVDVSAYGDLFHEKLGNTSKITQKTLEFRKKLFGSFISDNTQKNTADKTVEKKKKKNDGFSPFDLVSGFGDELGVVGLVIIALMLAYWASLYVFYAIGWLIAFTMSYFFVGTMKFISLLQNKEEVKINNLFEKLNNTAIQLHQSSDTLSEYVNKNKEGDWTESNKNFVSSVENNIKLVSQGLTESKKLYELIEKSKYSKVFNFNTFHSWVNLQITEPTRKFLELLILLSDNADKQIKFLQDKINNTDDYSKGTYELQLKKLQVLQDNINAQIITFTNLLERLQSQVFQKLHS